MFELRRNNVMLIFEYIWPGDVERKKQNEKSADLMELSSLKDTYPV